MRYIALGILLAASTVLAAAPAQRRGLPPPRQTERPVPFRVGETLTFDVSWSSYVTAGTATMTVQEKRPSFNSIAYYIVAEARPAPLLSKLYTLYYKLDTLLDVYTLLPQRGSLYSEEGRRHRYRITQFDHGLHKAFFEYRTESSYKTDFPVSPVVQDALSALYVVRALTLKAGDRMTMPLTDNGANYRAQLSVGTVERVKAPIGETSAWKVSTTVADDKTRQVGRPMTFWISDDVRRLPIKVQLELTVGSFIVALRQAT